MAAITNNQIFNWIGFTVVAQRNAIINDMISDGLQGLEHMTMEEVKEICSSYAKRTDGPFPIFCTPLQKQRLKSLVLWVQDTIRAQQDPRFPNGTTRAQFLAKLSASLQRDKRRREQKKVGEAYHDVTFNTKLKNQSQWEKFHEELQMTLSSIIGAVGAPITYVIREEEEAVFDEEVPYDEAIIQAVRLDGEDYKIDAQLVHQIILRNVHEDSNAYSTLNHPMK